MVAIVTGVGLGLERSSANVLGSSGLVGASAQGTSGDQVFVNAATGNLIDQNVDEILTGVGPSDVISRTYNSLTPYLNNGTDNGWLGDYQRKIDLSSLTGTVNTAGSTIKRVAADGSDVLYTYNSVLGAYEAKEGNGAYDTLTFASSTNQWTWTDGSTRLVEVYDAANGGRIVSSTDANGNALTYTYTGALLTKITTATSAHTEFTTLSYTGNNLTSVVTSFFDPTTNTTKTETRVYYTYDSSNRLASVSVDLDPLDNSLSTGGSYVTNYTYVGTSDLIASITQTDGSSVAFTYDASNRVATITQTAASGVTRVTTFTYGSGQTTITDPLGVQTVLTFDAKGELTKKVVDPSGLNLTSTFTYDALGDVLTISSPGGNTLTYQYDSNGNWISQVDSAGDTLVRTFGAQDQLLSETRFLTPAQGSTPAAAPETSWFVYNAQDKLRYSISPTGEVTQYQYNAQGQATSVIQYAGATYATTPPAAPVASNFSQTFAPGSSNNPVALSLAGGTAASIVITSGPANGVVVVNGASVYYTPNAGYTGADSFSYEAINAGGISPVATASLTVATSSGAPVANAINATVNAGSGSNPIVLNITGAATSVAVSANPTHGTVSVSGTTITYTPTAGYTGADSFQYTATNGSGTSAAATANLTVNAFGVPSTAAPVGAASSQTVAENATSTPIALSLSGGQATAVTIGTQPAHGTLSVNGTLVSYTPNAGYTGTDSFTFTASNAGGSSAAQTVTLTVAAPNQPAPVAAASTQTVAADSSATPIALNLSGGLPTGVTLVSQAAHGTVGVNGTLVTYTPTFGYTGADSFQYTATNAAGVSSVTTVTLNVAAQTGQPPPIAASSSQSVGENSSNDAIALSLSGGLASGVSITIQTAHGSLSVSGTSVTYTPNSGYTGTDSFTYTANNAAGVSSAATVSLSVVAPTAAPVAAASSQTVTQNTTNDPIALSLSGGLASAIAINTQPAHGTISVNGTSVTYTPTSGYTGADSFTYTASNAGGASGPVTVSLTVAAAPPAPTAASSSQTVEENAATGIALSLSGALATGLTIVTGPSHGTYSVSGDTLTYTPSSNYTGADSITYQATNAAGASSQATVSLTVAKSSGGALTPASFSASSNWNSDFSGLSPVSGMADGNFTSATSVWVTNADATAFIQADLGSVQAVDHIKIADQDSGIACAPSGVNFVNGAEVQYSTDGTNWTNVTAVSGVTDQAYSTISLGGVQARYVRLTMTNQSLGLGDFLIYGPAPTAQAVSTVVGQNSSSNPVTLNIGGQATSVAVTANPSHGTVSVSGTTITFTPTAGYTGADSFQYTATNATGTSAAATASINVAASTPPVANPISTVVGYNSSSDPIVLNVTGQATSVAVTTNPSHGTVSVSGTSITYTPTSGYSGADSFQYTATNASGTSAAATASITVASPAPAPTANNVSAVVGFNSSANAVVLNITGSATSVAVTTQPSHGTVSVSGTSITYTPTASYSGADSFQYTATNSSGTSAAATASLTVAAPWAAVTPIANPVSAVVGFNSSNDPIVLNITGNPTSVAVTSGPSHGSVTVEGAQIIYTPTAGYSGADSFQYTATNSAGTSSAATASLTVAASTAPPVPTANAISAVVGFNSSNTPVVLNVTGQATSVAVTAQPTHGTVSVSGTTIVYTPNAGYSGADSFQYTATNSTGTSAAATASLTVAASTQATGPFTETQLNAWVASLPNLSNSKRTDTTYDFRGNIATITSYGPTTAAGAGDTTQPTEISQTIFVYDQSGRLLETLPASEVSGSAYSYQGLQRLPTGTSSIWTYNSSGALVSATGAAQVYTYDGLGRLLTSTDLAGNSTSYSYNDASTTTTVTLPNGATHVSTYDKAGELVSYSESGSGVSTSTTTYKYDADGRLMSVTDPTGLASFILYDTAGRKTAAILPDGTITEFRYTANGQLAETIAYANKLTASQLASLASPSLDAHGNPIPTAVASIRPASSATDRYSWSVYDLALRLVETIDGAGAVTQFSYDGAGELVSATAYSNLLTSSQLTSFQSTPPTSLTLPTANAAADRTTRYFYDADGHLAGTLDGEGFLTQVLYDGTGQKVQTIAYATGAATSLWANGTFQQLLASVGTSVSDIHNWFVYDQRGLLRGVVDGEGDVTQYHYDPLGGVDQRIGGQKLSVATLLTTAPTLAQLTSLSTSGPGIDLTNFTYNLDGQIASEVRSLAGGATETDTYAYNSLGQLTSKTSASGSASARTIGYGYDARGRLTSTTSGNNGTTTYTYDLADRLVSKTDALANKTLYYYDNNGRLIYQVDPLGDVVQYGYDTFGERSDVYTYSPQIAASTLSGMAGGLFSAASSTVQSALTGLTGVSHSHVDFSVTGTVADATDAVGAQTTFAYDAFRDVVTETDPLTSSATTQTTRAFDRRGLLLSQTRDSQSGGLAARTAVAYDAFGRAIQVTDPNGNVRQTGFDRAGRVVSTTDAAGKTTNFSYDARSNLISVTDRTGNTTTYSYDNYERTITVTTQDGIVTLTKKNLYGQTVSFTDGDGKTTTYVYDADGNLKGNTDAAGDVTQNAYDLDDRLTQVTDPRGFVTKYGYDTASRVLTRTVDPTGLNLITTYAYDGKNEVVSITDPAGIVTAISYDLDGRKTQVVQNSGGLALTTTYQYDLGGRLLTLTEASGSSAQRVTTYAYDNLGRLTQRVVDAGSGHTNLTTTWTYDADGNAVSSTDAAGAKSLFVYDAENRLVYTVDPVGDVAKTSYDAAGRVISVTRYATSIATTTLSSWQSQTTPLTAAQVSGAVTTSSSDHTTAYVYDGEGRLAYSLDPNLRLTEYAYDGAGNLVHRTEYAGGVAASSSYSVAYVKAQIASQNLAANAANRTTRYVYDAANREAYSLDASGGVVAYSYDANGNQTKRVAYATLFTTSGDWTLLGLQSWATSNASAADRVSRTVYDDASRVAYQVDGLGYVTGFTYDADGRVKTQTRYAQAYSVSDGVTQSSLASLIGSPSGSAVTTYGYDTAGRLTSITDPLGILTALTLDAMGRVTDSTLASGTSDAADTHYVYDAAGRLTSKTTASGQTEAATVSYTYDGDGRVLTTTDANSNVTTNTYDGDGHLLTVKDPLSNVITNQYDAFGNLVKVTDQRGNSGYFYYDLLNRLTLQVDPEGYATATAYTIGNQVASVTRYAQRTTGTPTVTTAPTINTSAADETTTFTRDKLDRLTQVTDAGGFAQTYTLDAFGERTKVTNQLGGVTTDAYDADGNLISQTLPITSVTSTGSTEASSVTTTYSYDARGNRTKMVEASGLTEQRTTTYTYDLDDRLTQQTGDQVQTLANDLVTTSTVTPTQTFKYDNRGNLIEQDDANGARTLSYYDHNNHKIAQVDALGTLTKWTYDGTGNVLTQTVYGDFITLPTNPGGTPPSPVNANNFRQTLYAYDKNNRLTTTTIQNILTGSWNGTAFTTTTGNITTTNVYDADGNIVQTIDGNGNSSYFYYDKLNRRIGQVDPGQFLTTFTLDQDGNVTNETQYATQLASGFSTTTLPAGTSNAADRITNFTYDKNGHRLTEQRLNVTNSTINTSTGVKTDATSTAVITYTYNGLGEVTSKTEATGDQTTYTYDSEGRQTQVTAPSFAGVDFVSGAAETVQPVTTYSYDGLGDLTRMTVGDALHSGTPARVTTYSYGAGGRLASTTDASGFSQTLAYDAAGNTVKVGYSRLQSNGISVTEANALHYDLLGRLIYQAAASFNGTSWTFGDSSQTQYDSYGEVTGKGVNGLFQETSAYDAAGRLASTNSGDGSTKVYVYDGAGNQTLAITSAGSSLAGDTVAQALAAITTNGVIAGAYVAGYNATITTYDARGEALQTIQPFRQFDTNAADNTTITTSKAYDAFGEVTAQVDGRGNETDFTYNTEGKLTQQQAPSVNYTDTTGAVHSARPTTNNFYDLSGRLVATQDPNGNLNTRLLLAGTGYGGADAKETAEFHPDTGHPTWAYDVFGDDRVWTDALGNADKSTYDGLDRLLTDTHPTRSSTGTTLIDFYAYDGLGNRIAHSNSQLNTSLSVSGYSSSTLASSTGTKETTDYDLQGRVVKVVDLGGHVTTYAYAWSGTLATSGLGTFGGWTKTTNNPAGLTETDKVDYFGHAVQRTDFGGNIVNYNYDAAARSVGQTITTSGTVLQTLTDTYFNTNKLAAVADTYGPSNATSTLNQSYTYDKSGDRLTEVYTGSIANPVSGCFTGEPTQTNVSYENASATYDALGRVLTISDTGQNASNPISIHYAYDLNGNFREIKTTYNDLVTAASTTTDYWYLYDSMNRFTLIQGQLSGGAVTRGYINQYGVGGKDIQYDLDGNRVAVSTTTLIPAAGCSPAQDDVRTEYYVYSEDGFLSTVKIADADVAQGAAADTQAATLATATVRATDARDAMGRDLTHTEYQANGTTVAFSEVQTFNNLSQVVTDQQSTLESSGATNVINTSYDYNAASGGGAYNGAYQGGVATHSHSTGQILNGSGTIPTTDTVNSYIWFDAPRQSQISYTPNTSQPGTVYTSTFDYDANGHLRAVSIQDGRPRTVNYITDENLQVMSRIEYSNASSNPEELYYYFNGVQVGDIGNNGPSVTDYATQIAGRSATAPTGAFQYGQAVSNSDFSQGYTPIDGPEQTAATSYTVKDGDTLQSIAQLLWGDGNLWYLIAQANGLNGTETLEAGRTLTIPDKVVNTQQSASTFRVYDPNKAIGNVQPTTPAPPPPPAHHHGCGGFLGIIIAIIAIVVVAVLQPELLAPLAHVAAGLGLPTTVGAGASVAAATVIPGTAIAAGSAAGIAGAIGAGVIAGAVGSIVQQGLSIATGLQSKFSWSAVALGAIGGGVSAGLGSAASPLSGSGLGVTVGRAVAGNVITQGIGVATGLQKKFDWAGVAASAVEGFVGWEVGHSSLVPHAAQNQTPQQFAASIQGVEATAITGAAAGIAGAATRSVLTGSDFGQNLLSQLPNVIGQTIGNYISADLSAPPSTTASAPTSGSVLSDIIAASLQREAPLVSGSSTDSAGQPFPGSPPPFSSDLAGSPDYAANQSANTPSPGIVAGPSPDVQGPPATDPNSDSQATSSAADGSSATSGTNSVGSPSVPEIVVVAYRPPTPDPELNYRDFNFMVNYTITHKAAILRTSAILHIPTISIPTAIGEENRVRYQLKDLRDKFFVGEIAALAGEFNETPNQFLQDRYQVDLPTIEKGVMSSGTNFDPLSQDIGVGTINFGTAMYLVSNYVSNNPDDALGVGKYLNDPYQLFKDLINPDSDAQVLIAGLKIAQVQSELVQINAKVYNNLDDTQKEEWLDFGYRTSTPKFYGIAQHDLNNNILTPPSRSDYTILNPFPHTFTAPNYFTDPRSPFQAYDFILNGPSYSPAPWSPLYRPPPKGYSPIPHPGSPAPAKMTPVPWRT